MLNHVRWASENFRTTSARRVTLQGMRSALMRKNWLAGTFV